MWNKNGNKPFTKCLVVKRVTFAEFKPEHLWKCTICHNFIILQQI